MREETRSLFPGRQFAWKGKRGQTGEASINNVDADVLLGRERWPKGP